jgi:NAD(P)-dependent dehydrogenase (short-subunit alcohol dehydrogenase family)
MPLVMTAHPLSLVNAIIDRPMTRTYAAPVAEPGNASNEAMFRVDGKVAVVTGASSGLGERFARVLTAAGARVVLAARRAERLEKLAADLAGAVPVACDLSRPEDQELPVRRAVEEYGRVDVVVNNAAMEASAPALDEDAQRFREVLEVNLVAPFLLARAAARDMLARETGGSIINIASIFGLVGSRSIPQAPYTASKGGLVNLTRELSAQWAVHGIRVNAIAPGFFPSELTTRLLGDERGRNWIARNTPMGRPGAPHELDGALLFLAGDASTYVTGTTISVDGGWVAV